MTHNPTHLIARIQHRKHGEPVMQTSLALSDGNQVALAKDVAGIVDGILANANLQPRPGYRSEILLGATANRLARQEGLLEECRNLLMDLCDAKMPLELRRAYDGVMAELDSELGHELPIPPVTKGK